MKPLFKPRTVRRIIWILSVLLLAKLIWFVAEIVWLPSGGVDHLRDHRAKPLYYHIQMQSGNPVHHKPVYKPEEIKSDIHDVRLLAVYAAADTVVITVEYKGKSTVLGRGDRINGYTLEDAGEDYAVFLKEGKYYRLKLYTPKQSSKGVLSPTPSVENTTVTEQGEIIDMGDRKLVDKSVIDYYTAHIDDIYKNIGIRDMKKGDTLMGFQVTFVRRGSPFAKLGLRRGDILEAINGEALTSYSAAFDAYNNIKDVSAITLTIKRGNKEMELEYEIN